MIDTNIYEPHVKKKIDALKKKIRVLDDQKEKLEIQIEELKVGQSPIQPGDTIQWTSGNRTRYGKVRAVYTAWKDFEYKVHVLAKDGTKQIGHATVNSTHCPVLYTKEE